MPSHIKTYDESEDPEDHLKIFQAAAKTERWAMPTWCHMFNSTLTGNARVWFDDLPPESIDSYDDLKKVFLENYLQLGAERFDTSAGNTVNEILLKLNLPDHRILKDGHGGFVNSDYAKDPDKEAEYMALMEAVKEGIWLRGLLEELGMKLNTVAVNCDNQGAIHLSWNHVFHERTKHINVCYNFIREVVEAKTVEVLKVGTEHNATDALTKVVPRLKLQHCLELISVDVG
ncbi:retrovirus-related pol polyprotein from transposon TNT 1-94 [Tanacetum coccineum]